MKTKFDAYTSRRLFANELSSSELDYYATYQKICAFEQAGVIDEYSALLRCVPTRIVDALNTVATVLEKTVSEVDLHSAEHRNLLHFSTLLDQPDSWKTCSKQERFILATLFNASCENKNTELEIEKTMVDCASYGLSVPGLGSSLGLEPKHLLMVFSLKNQAGKYTSHLENMKTQGIPNSIAELLLFDLSTKEDFKQIDELKLNLSAEAQYFVFKKYGEMLQNDSNNVKLQLSEEIHQLQHNLELLQKGGADQTLDQTLPEKKEIDSAEQNPKATIRNIQKMLSNPKLAQETISLSTREKIYKTLAVANSVASALVEYNKTKSRNHATKMETKNFCREIKHTSRRSTRQYKEQKKSLEFMQSFQIMSQFQNDSKSPNPKLKQTIERRIELLSRSIDLRANHLKQLSKEKKTVDRYLHDVLKKIRRHNHPTTFLDRSLPFVHSAGQVAEIFHPKAGVPFRLLATIGELFNQKSKENKQRRAEQRTRLATKISRHLELFNQLIMREEHAFHSLEGQKEQLVYNLLGNRSLFTSSEFRSKLEGQIEKLEGDIAKNLARQEKLESKETKRNNDLDCLIEKIENSSGENKATLKTKKSVLKAKLIDIKSDIEEAKLDRDSLIETKIKLEEMLASEREFQGLNDWWDTTHKLFKEERKPLETQILKKMNEYRTLTQARNQSMKELFANGNKLIESYMKLGGQHVAGLTYTAQVISSVYSLYESVESLNTFTSILEKASQDKNISNFTAFAQLSFSTATSCLINPTLGAVLAITQFFVARKQFLHPQPTLLQNLAKMNTELTKQVDNNFENLSQFLMKNHQENHLELKALQHQNQENFEKLYDQIRSFSVQIYAQLEHIEEDIQKINLHQTNHGLIAYKQHTEKLRQDNELQYIAAKEKLIKKGPSFAHVQGLYLAITHSREANYNGIDLARMLGNHPLLIVQQADHFSSALAERLDAKWVNLPNFRLYLSLAGLLSNYLEQSKKHTHGFPEQYSDFYKKIVKSQILNKVLSIGYTLHAFGYELAQKDWIKSFQNHLTEQLLFMAQESDLVEKYHTNQKNYRKFTSTLNNNNKNPLITRSEQSALIDVCYKKINYDTSLARFFPINTIFMPVEHRLFEALCGDKTRKYYRNVGRSTFIPAQLPSYDWAFSPLMDHYSLHNLFFNVKNQTMVASKGKDTSANLTFRISRKQVLPDDYDNFGEFLWATHANEYRHDVTSKITIFFNGKKIHDSPQWINLFKLLAGKKELYFTTRAVENYVGTQLESLDSNYRDFADIIQQINNTQPPISSVNDYKISYPKWFKIYQKKYEETPTLNPLCEENHEFLFQSLVIYSHEYSIPLIIPKSFIQNLEKKYKELDIILQTQDNNLGEVYWQYQLTDVEISKKEYLELTLSCHVKIGSGKTFDCLLIRIALFDAITARVLQEENGLPLIMKIGHNIRSLLPSNKSYVAENLMKARINRPFVGLYQLLQQPDMPLFKFDYQCYTKKAAAELGNFAKTGGCATEFKLFSSESNQILSLTDWNKFLDFYSQKSYQKNREFSLELVSSRNFSKAIEIYSYYYETMLSLMTLYSDQNISVCQMQLEEAGIVTPSFINPKNSDCLKNYQEILHKLIEAPFDYKIISNFFAKNLGKSPIFKALRQQLETLEQHNNSIEKLFRRTESKQDSSKGIQKMSFFEKTDVHLRSDMKKEKEKENIPSSYHL